MLQLKRELRPRQRFIHRLEREHAWRKSIVFTSDHGVDPSTPTMHQVSGWSERNSGAGWSRFHSAECTGAPVSETPRQMSISDRVSAHVVICTISLTLYTPAGSCYMFSGCSNMVQFCFLKGLWGNVCVVLDVDWLYLWTCIKSHPLGELWKIQPETKALQRSVTICHTWCRC